MVYVDRGKAYDRVPRALIWWSLRNKRVPEAYIKIIQDMYEDCEIKSFKICMKTVKHR